MHRRRDIAIVTAIVVGLVVGRFIKRATFGLLVGLFIGLVVAMLIANRSNNRNTDEEKIPLFKSWSAWYRLVIGFLVVCIVVFYLLTKHFS